MKEEKKEQIVEALLVPEIGSYKFVGTRDKVVSEIGSQKFVVTRGKVVSEIGTCNFFYYHMTEELD